MNEKQLCMGCMAELQEGDTKCPHCGYPVSGINPPDYMRVRTTVGGRYLVGRLLETAGDSAVYLGLDTQDNSLVTVREFYPKTLCKRAANGLLMIAGEDKNLFEDYKLKFLSCARAVARLRDVLAIVPCFDILEENGTAYSISEYCTGVSLERFVREKGALSYEQARHLFLPLIGALATIHAAGVLHLGISPKNILIDKEGSLRIKNFSIPETHTASTECESVLLTGYAAPEQYDPDALCTETADVYGIAASLLFALTGTQPPEATVRAKKNDGLMMPADVVDSLPDHVKESLYRAMRVSPNHRTQTAGQFLDELSATSAVAALIDEDAPKTAPRKKAKKRSYLWLIFVAVFACLAILAVAVLAALGYLPNGDKTTVTTTTQGDLTLRTTTSTTIIVTKPIGNATVATPTLKGQLLETLLATPLDGNLTIKIEGYRFDESAAGTVLEQSPAAGIAVERGTTISVTLSAGPVERIVPDLSGWKEEHARLYLEALGFKVGESMLLQVSDKEYGIVDKSTPAAGSPLNFGETVTLWVSNVGAPEPDPHATTTQNSTTPTE